MFIDASYPFIIPCVSITPASLIRSTVTCMACLIMGLWILQIYRPSVSPREVKLFAKNNPTLQCCGPHLILYAAYEVSFLPKCLAMPARWQSRVSLRGAYDVSGMPQGAQLAAACRPNRSH